MNNLQQYKTKLIPVNNDESPKRALLIASETELDSMLENLKTYVKKNKNSNEYDNRNIIINIFGEDMPLDICTNHLLIISKISGYNELKPLIHETRTKEYRKELTLYEKINEFLYRIVGLEKKGILIENPDQKSWYLPKAIIYTGNVDYYDEDQNEKIVVNAEKHIEDIVDKIINLK